MNCPCCGVPVKDGMAFCPSCGTNMKISGSVPGNTAIPAEYKPLSPWAYIGYGILFAIPVVGFICLIVFSINGSNLNRRNYARSYWCALLIALLLIVAISLYAGVTGTSQQLIQALEDAASQLS